MANKWKRYFKKPILQISDRTDFTNDKPSKDEAYCNGNTQDVNMYHIFVHYFLPDSLNHLKGVEFAFRNTVAAGSTLVGIFHHGVFSVFINNYLQHAAGASFNATPAARAILLRHADYPVFRTLTSVQPT
jgi:hypothetical protein